MVKKPRFLPPFLTETETPNGHMTFNDSSGCKGPARSTMALHFGADFPI